MKKFIVLYTLIHSNNTPQGNAAVHVLTIDAFTFGECELIVKTKWAAVSCDAEIIQISNLG